MTRDEVYVKLHEIFRDIFDDESITICDTTTADDIDEWDSFEQVNIVVSCEKTFGVKFNTKEVSELHNVGGMVDLILSKVK